jgi:DNA-binding CsgD family transcriptional regulator
VVTDGHAAVIRSNRTAGEMFEAARPLRCEWGRLSAETGPGTIRLRAMIADAVQPRRDATLAGGTMAVTDAEGVRWGVLAAPLMPRGQVFDLAGRRLALVIASRLSGPITAEERLRQAFGLTPAEARLAAELAAGKTPDEASEGRQISLATIRSQLRSVFQKTDTRRQAQLVQLVTRLPDVSGA